jgi:cytidylate kinase
MFFMKRLILGLAGDPGSGKSALAEYLATQYHFYHFEGSDGIREAAKEEGVVLRSRSDYSNFHASLQKRRGQDILAQILLARPEDHIVFAGIRSTHNALTLQRAGGLIIGLDCPLDVCFSHIERPKTTFENFRQEAEAEWYSKDGYGADLKPVLAMADLTIDTSQPIEECFTFIDNLVARISEEK